VIADPKSKATSTKMWENPPQHTNTPTPPPQPPPSEPEPPSEREPEPEPQDEPKDEEPVVNRAQRVGRSRIKKKKRQRDDDVIELKPQKKVLRKARAKKSIFPILLTMAVLFAAGLFLIYEPPATTDKIKLIAPRKGQPALPAEQVKAKIQSALRNYSSDVFSGYVAAQNELIQAIEGDTKNAGAMALLCL